MSEPRISDERLHVWIEAARRIGSGVPLELNADQLPVLDGRIYFGAAVFDLADARARLAAVEADNKILREADFVTAGEILAAENVTLTAKLDLAQAVIEKADAMRVLCGVMWGDGDDSRTLEAFDAARAEYEKETKP